MLSLPARAAAGCAAVELLLLEQKTVAFCSILLTPSTLILLPLSIGGSTRTMGRIVVFYFKVTLGSCCDYGGEKGISATTASSPCCSAFASKHLAALGQALKLNSVYRRPKKLARAASKLYFTQDAGSNHH